MHKAANVLDKMPRSVQPAAKADLREIWQAPDRAKAEAALATFAEKYGAKYGEAVASLAKVWAGPTSIGLPCVSDPPRHRSRRGFPSVSDRA